MIPKRMQSLPIDPKWKLPIPWFVQWIDDKPQFPVMDGKKWVQAVSNKLCWICGKPITGPMAFVIGPMCGINRASAEPPSDLQCALYAAQTCPFLVTPKMKRLDVDHLGVVDAPGVSIQRNPGCCAVWITKSYDIIRAPNGPLIKIGDPQLIHWFAQGRKATRAEIMESIGSGLPILQNIAREDGPHAEAELAKMTNNLMRLLPR